MPDSDIELSVVIPIRDEEPALDQLHAELTRTLGAWGRSYEVIFVDDGSTDKSFELLKRMQALDPHVRLIRFRRNFGQTAAFSAGFAHARGDIIVTSDGDLQNDPADIPALIAMIESGYDIVCGWRKHRKDAFLSRLVPPIIAQRLISLAADVRPHGFGWRLEPVQA